MTRKTLILFFYIVTSILNGEEIVPLSEIFLGKYDNQEVYTRGFWYPYNQEYSILALEPNLKSCCIGNGKNQERQLLLLGDIQANPNAIIELKGRVERNSGEGVRYFLHNAEVREHEKTGVWVLYAIGGVLLIIFGIYTVIRLRMDNGQIWTQMDKYGRNGLK